MKLAGSNPEPEQPTAPSTTPEPSNGGFGDEPQAQPSSDDKPFDAEPFNAGVEADEESDPKKFIQQLTGKLGQSLRKYNEQQGQPDFELEKFAINSLLSATHTSEMDQNDQDDIIKKVKTAGNDENNNKSNDDNQDDNSSDNGDNNGGNDNNDDNSGLDFGDNSGEPKDNEENMDEQIFEEGGFLINPKKNNMFQPGSNDKLKENLDISKKSSTFDKNLIKAKLKETFNQEDETMESNAEPMVKPAPVKTPTKEPSKAPSRRNKPFLPMPTPGVQPDPKAIKEIGMFNDPIGYKKPKHYETYHKTLSSALDEAGKYVIYRGYDAIKFDINDVQHVKYGETQRFHKDITKDGKPQGKTLNIQIYRMDSGNYELNMYIG